MGHVLLGYIHWLPEIWIWLLSIRLELQVISAACAREAASSDGLHSSANARTYIGKFHKLETYWHVP